MRVRSVLSSIALAATVLVAPYAVVNAHASDNVVEPKIIGGETAQVSAIRFACLTRLHAVMLDRARLPVDFAVGTDARTDRPALVAMIDVRALAVGRHELVVVGPPLPGDVGAKSTVDRIQFWR